MRALTEQHAQAEKRLLELDEKENRLLEKEAKLAQKIADIAQKEAELSERESREESIFVREQRAKIENLVRELREGEITREKNLRVRSLVNELSKDAENQKIKAEKEKEIALDLRKNAEEAKISLAQNGMKISQKSNRSKSSKKTHAHKKNRDALENAKNTFSDEEILKMKPNEKRAAPILHFAEGFEVLAGATRTKGTLIREEKKGVWLVSLGSMRMSFREKDLVLIGPPKISKTADYTVELSNSQNGDGAIFSKDEDSPKFELRLLGMREEEAKKALRRQLDLCTLSGFHSFSVIHGKGDGILQQAVQDLLSHYPGVKSFRFAPPEDGGFGKTYVEMA